jgi:hypothetical protein
MQRLLHDDHEAQPYLPMAASAVAMANSEEPVELAKADGEL